MTTDMIEYSGKTIDKSQARGYANRIMRILHRQLSEPEFTNHGSHRKLCKAVLKRCRERSTTTLIAQRNEQTKYWEVIWGEWSLFTSAVELSELGAPVEKFDKIAFDLTFTNPSTPMGSKIFYVELSKHALIRLLMRSKYELKTPSDLGKFLQRITRELVFAGLELARRNRGHSTEGYTLSEYEEIAKPKNPKVRGYVIIDGFYLPLSYSFKFNNKGFFSRLITVTTFMPDEYESSKKALQNEQPLSPDADFFLYEDVFPFLQRNSRNHV